MKEAKRTLNIEHLANKIAFKICDKMGLFQEGDRFEDYFDKLDEIQESIDELKEKNEEALNIEVPEDETSEIGKEEPAEDEMNENQNEGKSENTADDSEDLEITTEDTNADEEKEEPEESEDTTEEEPESIEDTEESEETTEEEKSREEILREEMINARHSRFEILRRLEALEIKFDSLTDDKEEIIETTDEILGKISELMPLLQNEESGKEKEDEEDTTIEDKGKEDKEDEKIIEERERVLETVREHTEKVTESVTNHTSEIRNFSKEIKEKIIKNSDYLTAIVMLLMVIAALIRKGWNYLTNNSVVGKAKKIWEGIKDTAGDVADKVKQKAKDIIEGEEVPDLEKTYEIGHFSAGDVYTNADNPAEVYRIKHELSPDGDFKMTKQGAYELTKQGADKLNAKNAEINNSVIEDPTAIPEGSMDMSSNYSGTGTASTGNVMGALANIDKSEKQSNEEQVKNMPVTSPVDLASNDQGKSNKENPSVIVNNATNIVNVNAVNSSNPYVV